MSEKSTPKEIWVLAEVSPTPVAGVKSIWSGPNGETLIRGPVKLDVEKLSDNLRQFVESMNSIVAKIPVLAEPFRLDEIEMSVELTAEGSFQLIGGAKLGLNGGLKLTLKRKA